MTISSIADTAAAARIRERSRGLKVYVPWPGKTLFQNLAPFELDLKTGFPPADLDAGLVVIPFPFSTKPQFLAEVFEGLRAAWSGPLTALAAEGRLRIVVDASAEGYEHSDRRSDLVHEGLKAMGVPASCALVATQERNYADDYARYLRRRGLTAGAEVVIYDHWIKRFHEQFEERGRKLFQRRLEQARSRPRSRGRRFVSLNMTVRMSKLVFLLALVREGLWDAGHVSFGGLYRKASQFHPDEELRVSADELEGKLRRLEAFKDVVAGLAPHIPELQAKGQIIFGDVERDPETGLARKTPLRPFLPQYDDSWFTVVTETEMRRRLSRITEKPFAPLVNFHPLIVFGNPGALAQIRQLGYLTFGHVIDETYDRIEEPGRRFQAAFGEVVRLCRADEDELARMEAELADVTAFNAKWGMTRLPGIYRDLIDVRLMDRLWPERPQGVKTTGAS